MYLIFIVITSGNPNNKNPGFVLRVVWTISSESDFATLEAYWVLALSVEGLCYNRFPRIQGGGPKEPDLAQLLGWALSHQVSDSLTDRFTGVLMMRF